MFHVGDKVRALDDGSHYNITSRGWKGYVTRVFGDDIIYVSDNINGISPADEWRVMACYFELVESACMEEKEENKMDVKEIITEDERNHFLMTWSICSMSMTMTTPKKLSTKSSTHGQKTRQTLSPLSRSIRTTLKANS